MKILSLQLKRIGDLVLTAPALAAIKAAHPGSYLMLAVDESCFSLLGAFPSVDGGIIFGEGRGWTPWQQVLSGRFQIAYDFTGTDRSAAVAFLSRAPERGGFQWVREKNRLRAAAYTRLVNSPVRDFHTADHYRHLVIDGLAAPSSAPAQTPSFIIPAAAEAAARARLEAAGIAGRFVLCHPGTARREKYWPAARWAEVIRDLLARGENCVLTGGPDPFEQAHLAEIVKLVGSLPIGSGRLEVFSGSLSLLELAAFAGLARLVISCDTAMVHIAAALERPQIALFGPTNPYHWEPRHSKAVVFSASQPEAPLAALTPRMKGGPMGAIPAAAVIQAAQGALESARER